MKAYNVFAYELKNILTARGQTWGALYSKAGIHPEKIARLHKSLDSSLLTSSEDLKFPTLNPIELATLKGELLFTETEWAHIHAALLATFVESLLAKRVGVENAFNAATMIFNLLAIALQQEIPNPIIGMYLEQGEAMTEEENKQAIEAVWTQMDDATLALHMSYEAKNEQERFQYARTAYDGFALTLQSLQAFPHLYKRQEEWLHGQQEALAGQQAAFHCLQGLPTDE